MEVVHHDTQNMMQEDEAMTWEPKDNLSEDLIRDFEEAFWQAVKQKGTDVLEPALQYGQATAANVVDKERRSPLHFAAALNQVDLVEKLVAAGAQMSPCSSRRQNAIMSQIHCILRRAWCISDTPGVPATAMSSSMCGSEPHNNRKRSASSFESVSIQRA